VGHTVRPIAIQSLDRGDLASIIIIDALSEMRNADEGDEGHPSQETQMGLPEVRKSRDAALEKGQTREAKKG